MPKGESAGLVLVKIVRTAGDLKAGEIVPTDAISAQFLIENGTAERYHPSVTETTNREKDQRIENRETGSTGNVS
jgi:hypothetical protein